MELDTMKTAAKKIVWTCAVTAVLFLAQGLAAGAVLQATPDHVEFGTVDEGDPVVTVSEIVNTGDTPVEITNVRTT